MNAISHYRNHEGHRLQPGLSRQTRAATRLVSLALGLLLTAQVDAIIAPAPDRAFSPHPTTGVDIREQMTAEASNSALATVVYLGNSDTEAQFGTWTGTLISSNWILTCAHALQGTNGSGGGIRPDNLSWYSPQIPFQQSGEEEIAEFIVHTNWQYQGYSNGYDIALMRLAHPVTQAVVYPRLSASRFTSQRGVIIAGYGEQGDGDSTNNRTTGTFTVGVNTLDGLGGQTLLKGNGQNNTAYTNWASSVAFMDFDKWEQRHFSCGVYPGIDLAMVLSAFSTMGFEREATMALNDPCATDPAPLSGVFDSFYCDFLPGAGDSGGPAFLWPTAPTIPTHGYYLTAPPTMFGIASYRGFGDQPEAYSLYGNVAAYTLVEPHLGWIYNHVPELANQDSDGDGQTDQQEWLAGTSPYAITTSAPATYLRNPYDVQVANVRILEERAVGAEETEVEFAADLLNEDTGRYRDLSLTLNSNLPASAVVLRPQMNYLLLAESGTALAGVGETLVVRVANADLAEFRQNMLAGDVFAVSAYEEQVYSGPTKFIDAPTDQAFESLTFDAMSRRVLVFSHGTELLTNSLQAGDLLIANAYSGGYRPAEPPPVEEFARPYLSQQIPFEVAAVNAVEGKIQVVGYKRDLSQILKSGTFLADDENFNGSGRDLLDPPVENTYTEAEKEERALQAFYIGQTDPGNPALADLAGFNAIPWRFNELKITDYLQLSGQVLLRSSGLRFQVSFRDFAIKRASVGIDAGVVANLVIETTGTNNNTSVPLAEKQKELAHIPLPGIPINIGGVPCAIAPTFVLSVGAEANAPGGLSIPLETSATVGSEIGWYNGQTFVNPIKEFVAPHVSDPTVFDAVTANARAWVEARLEVNLSVAGGLVTAGPSLAIQADATFDLSPLNDPWWTLEAGADLVGRFDMNLLGFNVVGTEASEDIATFFHRDAGGPLIQGGAKGPRDAGVADLQPKSGKNTRWGLAFAAPNASASYSKGFVTPLAGGGYFVGGSAAIPSFLGRVSATGNMLWAQTFPTGAKPVDGVQLADGSIMVAGYQGLDWWLAKYDTNGVRQSLASYRTSADLRKLAVGFALNGDPEFYLVGFLNQGVVTQSDPLIVKLDKNGQLLWSKVYTLDRDDEVYGIHLLQDGNLLLMGATDSKVGEDPLVGAGRNGLLMKITPDGDVIWAKAVPGRWGMAFNDAAEAADGTLYVVGSHGDIVRDYYPSIFAGKFSANGELFQHVLIGEDSDWDDALPNGGDTPYDFAAQAAWTGDSLVMVGTTGLGSSASAWAASLTDELGVRWFSAFDGPGATAFADVAITSDGFAALGWADSIWSTKFPNRTPAWLLSLPWEGLMRFHPDTMAQSAYLQPHVFLSSTHPDFVGTVTLAPGQVGQMTTADVPFVVSNTVPAVGGNVTVGVATTFVTARLERLDPAAVDGYDAWAAYHQLTGTNSVPTGDFDGDGIQNGAEFFFGLSPLVQNTNTSSVLAITYDTATDTVAIEFNRAQVAASQTYTLQYSTDLTTWMPTPGTMEQLVASFADYDQLRLLLPSPSPNAAFFRLQVPIP